MNNWGDYATNIHLWEDCKAPYIKIRHLNEFELDDLEECGLVTDRLIGAGSSFLTKSPENGLFILNKCIMRKMFLTNITFLHFHHYLQYVDLAYNSISNLNPLSGIPYLMYLNVSHNKLVHVLRFLPPWYLTYVNLSFNHISVMDDLSAFWSIVKLDLSHNTIERISGLENLKYLQSLNLSYNLIAQIENLHNINLRELNLEGNYITSFKTSVFHHGIHSLPNLHTILLNHNRLSNLDFFKDAHTLRLVDLRFNKISDLLEITNLSRLIYEVDLRGNPCTKWPNYRDVLLFSIPNIMFIDGAEVAVPEKVSAATLFGPPVELTAARTVAKLVLLEQINPPRIEECALPYDKVSPPLIILTGPSAVKKIALGLHIARSFPMHVRYCQWYTTKEIEGDKDESEAFIFVKQKEFNEITRHGDFLAIQELLGHSYGFNIDQISTLINENKIGITQMDLLATIQMYNRYSNVKAVLVLTKDVNVHRCWIQEKFNVYSWYKDSVENLMAVKIGKKIEINDRESTTSKLDFMAAILSQVINTLELPSYSMVIRPQGTGATTTDIILESGAMLQKAIITGNEESYDMEEKKHITFLTPTEENILLRAQHLEKEQKQKLRGLKVIMDEKSNIVLEDPTSKYNRHRAKMFYRLKRLGMEIPHISSNDDLSNSLSSEDSSSQASFDTSSDMQTPEYLKNMHTQLVLGSRKAYLDYHMNNPGFFCFVVLMDDYMQAFNRLASFTYEMYTRYASDHPSYSPEVKNFIQSASVLCTTVANELQK